MVTAWFDIQQLHDPVQKSMDDLKPRALVVVNGTESPVVAGSYVCETDQVQRLLISMRYLILRTSNTPFVSSFRTTSEISNSLRGRGIFLLAATVFRRPGRREVRAT